jgi:putative ABC transport system permease protein
MARRDALRARGRSILVLVMIALPVLAVTAADVVIATQSISGGEALERRLGGADALVTATGGGHVDQAFDPNDGSSWSGDGDAEVTTVDDVRRVLGRDTRAVELREGGALVVTDRGKSDVQVTEVDLRDPLAAGLFELERGRLPISGDEVVVNADLASRGPGLGEELELADGTRREVVGLAESSSYTGHPIAAGPLGAFDLPEPDPGMGTGTSWLVGAGPVSWDDVRALNAVGATVASRAVLTDPPPDSELSPEIASYNTGMDEEYLSILVLIVVMARLEVVLLAGPAFAVTARRQARTLTLIAAGGGTPRQARRVVLASGVVLGAAAAVLGVLLGIGVGWVAVPIVQHYDGTRFGPFDVPWLHLVGIAGFGLLSALLAAVVPAWIASRQDVVAVLAGRRGDRRPSLRSPVLGVLLLGAGIAAAAYGATRSSAVLITVSAVVSVLGMILLVPVVVVLAARLSRRLPLVMRYAVRDAARHRTRTVPAVAAVAATVAGVVALGIAVSSDEAENAGRYTATVPMGTGVVTLSDLAAGRADVAREAVTTAIPDADVTVLRGVREAADDGSSAYWSFRVPRQDAMLVQSYGSTLGASVLVSDGDLAAVAAAIPAGDRERAAAVLAAGGVVAFTDRPLAATAAVVVVESYSPEGETVGRKRVRVPAAFVSRDSFGAGPQAVIAPAVAERLDTPVVPVAFLVSGTEITRAAERDAKEAVQGVAEGTSLYVERGYQAPGETVVIQLVLGALGAVLMLGGTLTATFLALSDARPDLATLSAVGASPRMHRGVAASYALVVGGIGALLGAAVGFIPGIAITYPLTSVSYGPSTGPASHYVDVPWLLILALVVALPLLTAALVAALARSRLPLVSRLD